jgi:hypothetical protein
VSQKKKRESEKEDKWGRKPGRMSHNHEFIRIKKRAM